MSSTLRVNELQNLSGTSAMTIDSNGNINQPAKAAFRAYLTGDQSAPSSNTFTTVQYNATNYNIGGHYNASTYTFTTPVAGIYYFYHSYSYVANTGSESSGIVSIQAGGATVGAVDFYIKGSNARYGSCCSAQVSLAAGVAVLAKAYGPARGIAGGDYGNSQFFGHLVS